MVFIVYFTESIWAAGVERNDKGRIFSDLTVLGHQYNSFLPIFAIRRMEGIGVFGLPMKGRLGRWKAIPGFLLVP